MSTRPSMIRREIRMTDRVLKVGCIACFEFFATSITTGMHIEDPGDGDIRCLITCRCNRLPELFRNGQSGIATELLDTTSRRILRQSSEISERFTTGPTKVVLEGSLERLLSYQTSDNHRKWTAIHLPPRSSRCCLTVCQSFRECLHFPGYR